MKFYVACGLTESRDREVVQAVVSYLEAEGYQVLDEHVAHEDHRARFTENTGVSLADKSEVEKEILIHDIDLAWVREAEGFIGIFFSASEGASIEFEHRRLLLQLQREGKILDDDLRSQLFLCIFLKDRKRSALLHGISRLERTFITQVYVDKKEDALDMVKRHVGPLSRRTA
jgi:hypothetical protein